jgi:hypothetical protein
VSRWGVWPGEGSTRQVCEFGRPAVVYPLAEGGVARGEGWLWDGSDCTWVILRAVLSIEES